MEETAREQAEQFYVQGLRVFARTRETVDMESLEHVAELWQKAWDLFQKIGDESRARELETSMAALYKRKYLTVHERNESRDDILKDFESWEMFFKIGCFGFGGPYAVFALLEDELVHHRKILSNDDFLEGAVLGNVLPGPVTMDIVTYTGYKLNKWSGALKSTLVFILPSFIMMIVLTMLYTKYSVTPRVTTVFKCLGAAVTGLILSVGLKLGKAELKDYREVFILVLAFVSTLILKLDIIVTVGVAGLLGIILYRGSPEEDKVKR